MIDANQLLDKIKSAKTSDLKYPFLLSQISDAPKKLYFIGKLPLKKDILIAIVGSRKCTHYGRQVAEDLAYNLAKEGIIIISGLALGIDSIAHQGALKARGKTIAVLGSGLKIIYPHTHRNLAVEIIKAGGAIVSEFEPDTSPYPGNFPLRNRIISGLSCATVVVEAAERSGALITAFSALDQNREVFAVPGSIYSSNSNGTNRLIKLGAHPVTSHLDILKELGLQSKISKKEEIRDLSDEAQKIYSFISTEPISIDKLKELSKLEIAVLNSTLVMLELEGLVKNIGGGQYIKIKN